MKSRRKPSVVIRHGGRIVLPPEVRPFKVGQRVYFSTRSGCVVIGHVPVCSTNGRFISRRVRRGTYQLAAHMFAVYAAGREAGEWVPMTDQRRRRLRSVPSV